MSIFFTSDLHLNHSKAIKFNNRPFGSVEEMNDVLIENFNSKVKHKDVTYILGDFAFGNPSNFIKRLNGEKILIKGNHDRYSDVNAIKHGFSEVYMLKLLKINKLQIIMCHYPMYSWASSHYGSFHIHGHIHTNQIDFLWNRYNVGVDVNDYVPLSMDELIHIFEQQKILNSRYDNGK